MKLKKQFADFYKEIRIDDEAHVLKDKREKLQSDIESKFPEILSRHDISINKCGYIMMNFSIIHM